MKLHELLGTKYPLIQGGMANIATGAFAAAVSNAGGLGLVGAGGMTTQMLREEIRLCRRLTAGRPFGVNIMLMHPDAKEMARIVLEEEVPVVTTGAGSPGAYMADWKAAGIKVFPVVPAAVLARRVADQGADGVIAEGTEAGGHIGEMATMALIPQVVDAMAPYGIPVVAAGGIADGRQLLAAFALGAAGAQLGTCLLAAAECPIHDNYKQAVLKAKDTDTVVTGRIGGVPVRMIKNKMSRQYLEREKAGATREELEQFTLGGLRRAVFDGDTDTGSVMAGQVAGMIREIRPVAQILEELYSGYQQRLAAMTPANRA